MFVALRHFARRDEEVGGGGGKMVYPVYTIAYRERLTVFACFVCSPLCGLPEVKSRSAMTRLINVTSY